MTMWDPTAKRTPVVQELDCSRDEDGNARATVTLTPWGTRERLAYQDGALDAIKMDVGEDGKTTMRRVSPAAIALLHLRLTVTDCSGFPDVWQDHPAGGDRIPVPFSFAVREHVETLDVEVYDEVVRLATAVQPMTPPRVKAPQDRRAPAAATTNEPAEDFDTEGADGDPTLTRSPRAPRPRR